MLYLALFVLAASAVSTTSKPSGGNGAATSKIFHAASDEGWCSQWTFENDCTEAQILAPSSSVPEVDEGTVIVIGECPDNFERACDMLYKDSKGEKFGSPLTASADKTSGCGKAEYVLLTDDCDTCSEIAGLHAFVEALGGAEELEEPTCSYRDAESFFKDFIRRLKDGELLYIGIAAAVVLVPLMCCICCCCCLLSSSPSQKVTYLSRV